MFWFCDLFSFDSSLVLCLKATNILLWIQTAFFLYSYILVLCILREFVTQVKQKNINFLFPSHFNLSLKFFLLFLQEDLTLLNVHESTRRGVKGEIYYVSEAKNTCLIELKPLISRIHFISSWSCKYYF